MPICSYCFEKGECDHRLECLASQGPEVGNVTQCWELMVRLGLGLDETSVYYPGSLLSEPHDGTDEGIRRAITHLVRVS